MIEVEDNDYEKFVSNRKNVTSFQGSNNDKELELEETKDYLKKDSGIPEQDQNK